MSAQALIRDFEAHGAHFELRGPMAFTLSGLRGQSCRPN